MENLEILWELNTPTVSSGTLMTSSAAKAGTLQRLLCCGPGVQLVHFTAASYASYSPEGTRQQCTQPVLTGRAVP